MFYFDWFILSHVVTILFLIGRQIFRIVQFNVFRIKIQTYSKFLLVLHLKSPIKSKLAHGEKWNIFLSPTSCCANLMGFFLKRWCCIFLDSSRKCFIFLHMVHTNKGKHPKINREKKIIPYTKSGKSKQNKILVVQKIRNWTLTTKI